MCGAKSLERIFIPLKTLLLLMPLCLGTLHAESMCVYQGKSIPCWVAGIEWSKADHGFVEKSVIDEWKWVDVTWPGTHFFGRVHDRASAMVVAKEAAQKGFSQDAYSIYHATQAHNPAHYRQMGEATQAQIVEYIRTH